MVARRLIAVALLGFASSFASAPAHGSGATVSALSTKSKGRPVIKLDRLTFPAIPGKKIYEKHLRRVLRREARRAEWGVGRGHKIEYRFEVQELSTVQRAGVLRVSCAATGELPKGKTAKSQLSFGGDPSKQRKLVKRVLEIVARGVITRLAQMERLRRGRLERAGAQRPASG